MKSKGLLVALTVIACAATAGPKRPSYGEAQELTRSMYRVVSDTSTWNKKPLPARIQAIEEAKRLVDDAERMFGKSAVGEFSECRAAAIAMKFYVLNLNDAVLVLEGRRTVSNPSDMLAPAYQGFQFGEAYRACQEQIQALEEPPKRNKT